MSCPAEEAWPKEKFCEQKHSAVFPVEKLPEAGWMLWLLYRLVFGLATWAVA